MKFASAILFLFFFTNSQGQNQFIGFKGGVSWTNINESNFIFGHDSRTGFMAGITYDYMLKPNLFIGADLLYNQKGFSNTVTYVDANNQITGYSDIKFNYDYLAIPLRIGLTTGKKIYGFSNLALVPAYLVKAAFIHPSAFSGNGQPVGSTSVELPKVSHFDFGGLVEIGGGYKFERYWIFSSLTYQQSFTSITNSDYLANSSIKHYGLFLSFGLKYKLQKN